MQNRLTHPKYRPDIDGLRAVAILSVVVFHTFPNVLKGGFVGVDIFFVISGFLISAIIFENIERGSFNLTEFYARRIKRIFPALILVIITCQVFGWFTLFSTEYSVLGKQIMASASFVPNIFFWLGDPTDYWNSGDIKTLLHLWSLGVEEQFYLIWPLLIFLAYKKKADPLLLITLLLITSFILNVTFIHRAPAATFFLPLTRFWELLIGSFLAYSSYKETGPANRLFNKYLTPSSTADWKSFIGMSCISFALLFLDKDKAFPGWWALLPTTGAYLIISAGQLAWLNRKILSHPIPVWFGLISYPLYLWHWPILAFATTLGGQQRGYLLSMVAFISSITLAWFTLSFIEKPLKLNTKSNSLTIILCTLMVVIGFVGFATHNAGGFDKRKIIYFSEKSKFIRDNKQSQISKEVREARREECNFYSPFNTLNGKSVEANCIIAGVDGTWFLWGDSHAEALSLGLRSILPKGYRLAQVATSSCIPSLSDNRCNEANNYALSIIKQLKPETVFLAQRGEHEQNDWLGISNQLTNLGVKRVILIGPAPQWKPSLPIIVANNYWGGGD